jgi:hypothetical protein
MKYSISGIKLFKSCRRAYELKYIEGLEPVQKADSIQTGLSYHAKIEEFYKTGEVPQDEDIKTTAMAMAYVKYIAPTVKIVECEKWVEWNPNSAIYKDSLIGRIDGITEDGVLVEHKTTSGEIGEDYEYMLQWDEQLLAYMLMTGAREMWYTVCRKPTIRQKKNETDEEFLRRCVEWFDEDTDSKIKLMSIQRSDEEVTEFRYEIVRMMALIDEAKHYYKNTAYCKHCGRMCDYAGVCLHYDPKQEYVDYERVKR